MATIEDKYRKFLEITLVPLNGARPVIYNFDCSLSAVVSDLKRNLLQLMKMHNHRIKYSLQGFVRDTEIHLKNEKKLIVPIEIMNLCRTFYDPYYPMSTNINLNNLVCYAWKITKYGKFGEIIPNKCDQNNFFELSKQYTTFFIYELMNNDTLKKQIPFNDNNTVAIPVYHFYVGLN